MITEVFLKNRSRHLVDFSFSVLLHYELYINLWLFLAPYVCAGAFSFITKVSTLYIYPNVSHGNNR